MQAGQAVRYRGKSAPSADRHGVEVGTTGEIIGVHRIEETWFAVLWEGMSRPTFHLIDELEPVSPQ